MLRRSHEFSCAPPPFAAPIVFLTLKRRPTMLDVLGVKIGYLATGLALIYVGMITFGVV